MWGSISKMSLRAVRDLFRRLALATIVLTTWAACAAGQEHRAENYIGRVQTVDAPTIQIWMDEGRDFTIVDVRSEGEYDSDGHAPDSQLHPWSIYNRDAERNRDFLKEMQAGFPPDATIVLVCSHGMRASQAAAALQEHAGFTAVYVFPGGFEGHHMEGYPGGDGWKAAGLPVEDW